SCGRCRALFFFWRTSADIRKVLAHAHLPKENRSFENIIARCAAAVTPFALNVLRGVIGAGLLAWAIEAAVSSVTPRHPAGPFPIAASDKRLCRPRQTED